MPCAAKPVYVRFQANFGPSKLPHKFVTYLLVDAQIIQFATCLFIINNIIFHSFAAGNCVSI